MAPAAIALMAAGTAVSVAGTIASGNAQAKAGRAQQQAAEYAAQQMRVQAGQERAAAQRTAMEQRREADKVRSRGLALAAASGGGASDPSVVNLLGDIDQEGTYRALTAMFEGEEKALGLETGAQARSFEGEQAAFAGRIAKKASRTQALSTVLSSAGKIAGTYGDDIKGWFS